MEINASKDHPFRVITGALSASAFAATLALASIEHRSCLLNASAYCFSVVIVPLALICSLDWPKQRAERLSHKLCSIVWGTAFFSSVLVFAAGVFLVAAFLSWIAAALSGFASGFLLLASFGSMLGHTKTPKQ